LRAVRLHRARKIGIQRITTETEDVQGGVAGLQGEGIDEEVHEDDVAFRAVGVGPRVWRPSVHAYECGVDVVQQVGPDFPDVWGS
jgi:hypothetical protein